jgi:glycosyltransferase involved in cell wall biosynthesis
MSRVSVIIPTYRRPELLPRAIASVLCQTFEDFELLIVDDASNDNTDQAVKSIPDKRIRYCRNEINKGGAASRNRGIREAQSSYIAFLDDDDEWLPEKLELQVALLDQSPPEVGGIYAGYEKIMSTTGESLGITLPTKRGDLSYELLLSNPLAGTSALLLRKECFEKVGLFDEELPSYQDYDLWIRISKAFEFDYVNKVLYRYHVHGNKIWTNPQALSKGLDIMVKKHCMKDLAVRKNFSAQFLSLGVMFCYQGDLEKGRKAYWRAIRLYPFEIRNYFNLFLSLSGVRSFIKLKELKQKYSH